MANIIFTNNCNIRCPFCFAAENNNVERIKKQDKDCNIKELWNLTHFIDKNEVRFCGGEPTQNVEIADAFKLLLKDNKKIFLMSNGIWPDRFTEFIKSLTTEEGQRIGYLFNILHPSFYNSKQWNQINTTLDAINSSNTTLGFTIYKKDFEFKYIIDLAKKYQIRTIRWSVAAPCITEGEYNLESYYYEIADKLHSFIKNADSESLMTIRDCGYVPPCYFSKEKLFELKFQTQSQFTFNCSSAPVDIDNKGEAWRCYGLYSVLKANIQDYKGEKELRDYFNRRTRILNNLYLYEDCKNCDFWEKSCSGGCYAIRIKKALKQIPDLCLFPIDNDREILQCSPYRTNRLSVKAQNPDSVKIYWNNNKVIENPDENSISFISEIDGRKTIQDLIDIWAKNFSSYEQARITIVAKCRELFEKDMIGLHYDYKIEYKNKPAPVHSHIYADDTVPI